MEGNELNQIVFRNAFRDKPCLDDFVYIVWSQKPGKRQCPRSIPFHPDFRHQLPHSLACYSVLLHSCFPYLPTLRLAVSGARLLAVVIGEAPSGPSTQDCHHAHHHLRGLLAVFVALYRLLNYHRTFQGQDPSTICLQSCGKFSLYILPDPRIDAAMRGSISPKNKLVMSCSLFGNLISSGNINRTGSLS